MNIIESVKNNKIKNVKKLRDDKAYRKEQGLFIVEGENLFNSIPDSYKVMEIYINKNNLDKFSGIISKYDEQIIYLVSDHIMKTITDTISSSGILAVVKMQNDIKNFDDDLIIVCDRVRDPGNLGAIIRTMAACDIKQLLCINCVDFYSNKVIRASMGGHFFVKHKEVINEDEAMNLLEDYLLISLALDGDNIFSTNALNKKTKYALVVGNEAQGISSNILERSNIKLTIPMSSKIESLNASVAASIAIYQIKEKIQ